MYDKNNITDYLSIVVNQNVNWESYLYSENRLRIFFKPSILLSKHQCNLCGNDMNVILLKGEKICVDADYFIQLSHGVPSLKLNSFEKIATMPSCINLHMYASDIEDMQSSYLSNALDELTDIYNSKFGRVIFEKISGKYKNICDVCETQQDESSFLIDHKLSSLTGHQSMVLNPAKNSPLVINCSLTSSPA